MTTSKGFQRPASPNIAKVPLEFQAGGGLSRDERNLQFFNQFVLVFFQDLQLP